MTLSWEQIQAIRAINSPAGGSTRTLVAEFRDLEDHKATRTVGLLLKCEQASFAACDGVCQDLDSTGFYSCQDGCCGWKAITAGWEHTCGIRSDGSVACWGRNDDGQSSPPLGSFTAITAGGFHSCGMRSDASIACWGRNDFGQSSPTTEGAASGSTEPEPEPEPGWTCDPAWQGDGDCDCGCGILDTQDCGAGGGCAEDGCYDDKCQYCTTAGFAVPC